MSRGLVIDSYYSREQLANGNYAGAGPNRSAADYMSAGASALPGALNHLAQGLDKLNGVVFEAEIKKRQEDLNIQAIQDLNELAAVTQKDNDDYMQKNKFADAAGAEQYSSQAGNGRLDALREKYQHNPGALKHIETQGGAIVRGSVNAMRDYGNRQHDLYRQQVIDGRTVGFLQFAEQSGVSDQDAEAGAATLRGEISAMYAGGDPTAALAKFDESYKAARKSAERNRLVSYAMQNPGAIPQDLSDLSGGGGATSASVHSATRAAMGKVGYEMGARDPAKGKVDCSGWVCKINPHPLVQKGQTAAGIIKAVTEATGVQYGNADLTPDKVREGMLIGMDASTKDTDRWKGIDHIVQVYRDPETGEMMVSESSKGKGGVAVTPYAQWYKQWSGKKLFGVVLPGGPGGAEGTEGGPDPAAVGAKMNLKWHTPVEAYSLYRELRGFVKEQQREAKEIAGEFKNASAYYLETGDSAALDSIDARLAATGGAGATVRAQFNDQRRMMEKLQPVTQGLSTDSFSEQRKFVDEWAKGAVSEANAATVVQVRDHVLETIEKREKAFLTDPAGMVAQQEAKRKAPAAENVPGSLYEKTKASMARQQQLVGGTPGFTPKVFTAAQAVAHKEKLKSPDTPIADKLNLLKGIRSEFGDLSRKALDEIGVSSAARAAARLALDDPATEPFARDLLAVSLLSDAEGDSAATMTKKARDVVNGNAFIEHQALLAARSPAQYEDLKGIQDAAARLVMIGKGDSLQALEKPYDFILGENFQLRIPKHSGVDADAVEFGLTSRLDTIIPLLPEHTDPIKARAIRQSAYWESTEDGHALLIYDGQWVPGRDKKPIALSFKDAAQIGMTARRESDTGTTPMKSTRSLQSSEVIPSNAVTDFLGKAGDLASESIRASGMADMYYAPGRALGALRETVSRKDAAAGHWLDKKISSMRQEIDEHDKKRKKEGWYPE